MPKKTGDAWRRWPGRIGLATAALVLVFALFRVWKSRGGTKADLSRYDYRATRMLVRLTARAAELLEREGAAAFADFREHPEKWSVAGESYLYVYDWKGTNIFHGGYPELEGQNLGEFTDLLGKEINHLIIDQLENHSASNPHGWCHYLWAAPGSLQGAWKSSCHFPANLPDGRKVYVGSGYNIPLVEREFFRIIVDQAVELLARKGKAALPELKAPEGPFTIYDETVFVLDLNGRAIIDPSLDLNQPRNLFQYQDLSGRYPLRELAEWLKQEETAWVVTLNRSRSGGEPLKQGIYGRQAAMDGRPVIVGALCELPHPAWMR